MEEIQASPSSNKENDHAYNGDIVRYTTIKLFDHHLMDQFVQPEDVADQITALHKILEQDYDPNEEPQVYYKTVQDARNTLEPLNETIDEATLIRHGLNQFKEHIDFKLYYVGKTWKQLPRVDKTWKNSDFLEHKETKDETSLIILYCTVLYSSLRPDGGEYSSVVSCRL